VADTIRTECASDQSQELVHSPGETAILQVYVDGDPNKSPSSVRWRHFDMYINGSSRRTLQDGNRRLEIERLMLEDSGIYTAEVTQTVRGKVKMVMATITLNVHGI
jgi:hypothetical protein